MKQIHFTTALAACGIALCCCTRGPDASLPSPEQDVSSNPHLIPLNSAVASLYDFLDIAYNDESTKALSSRAIANTSTIRYNAIPTKSSSDIDADEILYLVNFENNQGYAILAADDRISDDVLVVTEQGALSESALKKILKSSSSGTSGVPYPEYSSTGDGIYTDERYPGFSFLNPNTFDPYDSDSDDTYVGDLDAVVDSAYFKEKNGTPLPGLGELIQRDLDQAPSIGVDDGDTYTELVSCSSYVYASVSPMLTFCKEWTQDTPFNDICPIVHSANKDSTFHADAGCVPLAIAKILTYHQHPGSYTVNGYSINWTDLKTNYSGSGKNSAGMLLRGIGASCGAIYFENGTFTFPKRAKGFMEFVGYSNVKYSSYSTDDVTSSLKNGCPVFVCSLPKKSIINYDFRNSHAWNIDGYKTIVTEKTYKYYKNGEYRSTSTSRSSATKVHCDFGWGGVDNGYYTSGMFKLGSSDAEVDSSSSGDRTNYNYYLKTITYEKP